MNGESKKHRRGLGIGWLEVWATFFAFIVVIGLVVEDTAEPTKSINKIIGEVLVVAGVFLEAFIGILIARGARKAELEASREMVKAQERIAQAGERAAQAIERAGKAEQATAEANLARVKLEQRFTRKLSDAAYAELIEVLKPHAGRRADILLIEYGDMEVLGFGARLSGLFREAGWLVDMKMSLDSLRMHGKAVTIGIVRDDEELRLIAESVAAAFHKSGIPSSIFFGIVADGLAPFTIQVGKINVAEEPPV